MALINYSEINPVIHMAFYGRTTDGRLADRNYFLWKNTVERSIDWIVEHLETESRRSLFFNVPKRTRHGIRYVNLKGRPDQKFLAVKFETDESMGADIQIERNNLLWIHEHMGAEVAQNVPVPLLSYVDDRRIALVSLFEPGGTLYESLEHVGDNNVHLLLKPIANAHGRLVAACSFHETKMKKDGIEFTSYNTEERFIEVTSRLNTQDAPKFDGHRHQLNARLDLYEDIIDDHNELFSLKTPFWQRRHAVLQAGPGDPHPDNWIVNENRNNAVLLDWEKLRGDLNVPYSVAFVVSGLVADPWILKSLFRLTSPRQHYNQLLRDRVTQGVSGQRYIEQEMIKLYCQSFLDGVQAQLDEYNWGLENHGNRLEKLADSVYNIMPEAMIEHLSLWWKRSNFGVPGTGLNQRNFLIRANRAWHYLISQKHYTNDLKRVGMTEAFEEYMKVSGFTHTMEMIIEKR